MLGVVLAILAAVANAVASVSQRKGTRRLTEGRSVGLRMVWHLLHEPVWVAGIGAIAAGFLLQAAALATGPIALVQPVLVLELGFTLMLSSVVFRTRLHRREWGAVIGMSAGLALLLIGLDPTGGDPRRASPLNWVVGCAVVAAIAGPLLLAGHRHRHAQRAAYLGVATGVVFGFTAALVAGMGAAFAAGIGAVFTAWQTYAVVLVGPAGFFLLQNALRAGRLVASQPGLTLANPLVAIGWGIGAFGEQVRTGGWIAGDVVGALVIAGCTVLLSRSPLLHGERGESEQLEPRR